MGILRPEAKSIKGKSAALFPDGDSRQHRERGRLTKEWENLLRSRFEGGLLVGLGFPPEWQVGQVGAERKVGEWILRPKRLKASQVSYALACETGPRGGLHHLNGLLSGLGGIPLHDLESAWEHHNGLCRVQHFDPARGGARYIARKIAEDPESLLLKLAGERIGGSKPPIIPVIQSRPRPGWDGRVAHESGGIRGFLDVNSSATFGLSEYVIAPADLFNDPDRNGAAELRTSSATANNHEVSRPVASTFIGALQRDWRVRKPTILAYLVFAEVAVKNFKQFAGGDLLSHLLTPCT